MPQENNITVVTGTRGNSHVANGPLTTSVVNTLVPDLLLSEIDRRIVKIRPSSTPLDQISRLAGCRRCRSMVVDYYSVDTKPSGTKVRSTKVVDNMFMISTEHDAIFAESETVMFPDTYTDGGEPLVGYVVGRDLKDGVLVLPVNVETLDDVIFPAAGHGIVRMGRAAGELDVQTPQFEALPRKATNYCQIFKAQVEESTLQKLTNKEVGWTFNDQEEVAVIDMRQGLERNFLFGAKARIKHPTTHEEIMLTGGIWYQTDHQFEYDTEDTLTEEFIVDLTRHAFEGASGSLRKVLVAGTGLIDRLNKIGFTRMASTNDSVTKWGIDFTELHSKFGTLFVVHSETFDQCGCPDNGMVIDPQYITKYSFIPMQAERLDLKSTGVRNTDAVVITEASCLVLRYPNAHLKVIGNR